MFIAYGLGDASDIDSETVRRGVGAVARGLNDGEQAAISTEFGVGATVEGLLLGGYAYTGIKSSEAGEPAHVTVVA
ncbi:hypothetical protein NPS74_24655, partial [Cutibacterium acnes subsp. acnes]|nr:hypothetical protein [Cutibacterium acnes subsp. acnes]